jgi:hypothetical protein
MKTCLVIAFWLGDRRKPINEYKNTDRLTFVKKQVEMLNLYKNSLNKIIFNFNLEEDHRKYIDEINKIVPKKIQNADVEIVFRENYGMSYGAWSDAFAKNKNEFDYWFFDEDDYFFMQHDWDQYFINKFESLDNCGYLCCLVRENHARKHAGHSVGISSKKVLLELFNKFGELPHSKMRDYGSNESEGQIDQTYSIVQMGYDIYDIRDDYKVDFVWALYTEDVVSYFTWNKKEIVVPAVTLYYPTNHTRIVI